MLEQAGFSSSRRLAGVFYGYDFTVLRVFFTAAVTAMSGVLLLGYFGLLDTDADLRQPHLALARHRGRHRSWASASSWAATVPAPASARRPSARWTPCSSWAAVCWACCSSGRLFPSIKTFFDSSSLGPVKVFESLNLSGGGFAFLLIAMAVMAFAVTSRIERKVNPDAPSRVFPRGAHRIAAAALLALGLIFVILPERKAHLIGEVSKPDYIASHPVKIMPVDELAFRLVDNDPRLQIVDVRAAADFARLALPGARNVSPRDFFGKDYVALLSPRHVTKVLVASDESQERAACLLLRNLGYENLAALEGGLPRFQSLILDSTSFVPTGGRWDNDVRTFRQSARAEINQRILAAKTATPKPEKKSRKIVGGC